MSQTHPNDAFSELVKIITELRSERGCPWDRKQTPVTLTKYLLEETQELAEAIQKEDPLHVREETGDLFFILILLIKTYEEKNVFTIDDVLNTISEKMIRRHPHVFSGAETGNESELRQQWEEIKAIEKNSMPESGHIKDRSK